MQLALTDDQRLSADSACALLAGHCSGAHTRAVMHTPDGHDAALWQQLGEQGWCGLLTAPESGGQGLGWLDAVPVLEAMGAHLACVPYLPTAVIAATALRHGSAALDLLADISHGRCVVALSFSVVAAQPACRDGRPGWRLDGVWPVVPSAHLADHWLLPVHAGETLLLRVPRDTAGLHAVPREGVDATRRAADVVAQGAWMADGACVARGAAAEQALQAALLHGAIALAAEQVGVASQCLALSCAHTLQREQFGRPVAGFQAVKHRCAQMLVAIELARSAVRGAAALADARPTAHDLEQAAAQALVAAHEAAAMATQETIQLHGGMGYTWECDAHLYLRRAQANRHWLGLPSVWLERVAAQWLDHPGRWTTA
ncbi:MAG: acyl-CoA dehydrogenase family protein [Rubrivivax sp.]